MIPKILIVNPAPVIFCMDAKIPTIVSKQNDSLIVNTYPSVLVKQITPMISLALSELGTTNVLLLMEII